MNSMGDCVPDRFYTLEDSIIRNRMDGTLIISQFVVMGTGVRELTMKLESTKRQFKAGGILKGGTCFIRLEGTSTMTLNSAGKICSVLWDFSDDRNANWINTPLESAFPVVFGVEEALRSAVEDAVSGRSMHLLQEAVE
eukprot:gene28528-31841_t